MIALGVIYLKDQLSIMKILSLLLEIGMILFLIMLNFFYIQGVAIGGSAFLSCLFFGCTCMVTKYLFRSLSLKRNGRRVQGVVTDVIHGKGGYTIISYTVGNEVYTHRHGWYTGKWQIGFHHLTIVYDSVHPECAYLEKYEMPLLILGSAVMAISTIGSLILTFYCVFWL